jgi:hypothetical protein
LGTITVHQQKGKSAQQAGQRETVDFFKKKILFCYLSC